MATKLQNYIQLAGETATQVTKTPKKWFGFLNTASCVYRYPFPDQLMIHSQRPKVTACAEFDLWTKRLNRHIRRGSKGIGLIAINRNGYWKNYHKEIMYECGGRLLEGLEKQEVRVKFRLAIAASISYVLLARCGFDPWRYLKSENFKDVPDVNM